MRPALEQEGWRFGGYNEQLQVSVKQTRACLREGNAEHYHFIFPYEVSICC